MLKRVLEFFHTGRLTCAETEMDAEIWNICQETQKKLITLNTVYHSDRELPAIMSDLIGEPVGERFRLFPPFYTDFGKIFTLAEMCLSIPAVIFRIRAASISGIRMIDRSIPISDYCSRIHL